MERQVNAIDANAVEELIFLGEGFHRRVPGQGQHIFFALNQAAGAIFLTGIGAGAAIAGIQHAVTFGKDVIDVLFHRPRRAHPPARHLPDNGIGPQEVLHFGFHVVVAIGADHFNIMPEVAQIGFRDFSQGVVQLAVRVAELFCAINNQDVAHFLSSTFQFCG